MHKLIPPIKFSAGTRAAEDLPDHFWFGSTPKLLADLRGKQAQKLIPTVGQAVQSYPFPNTYTLWPGPNSNSFTAWVSLEVPELGLKLPMSAIGKDWMIRNYKDIIAVGVDHGRKNHYLLWGGIASSNDTFVLTMLGFENISVYDASMFEWGNDHSLPMAKD